jgi:hypothetical protein
MNTLAKTRRRPVDISGGFPGMVSDRSDQFMQFLATNAEDAFTRPWHRLERGRRLNRIRKFVEEEAARFQFSETDQLAMFQMLEKSLDKKQLNSKSIVTYDTEQQKILEIKGLVFHKQADGSIVFQITERKSNTVRRSKQAEKVQQPTQPAQPPLEPKKETPTIE